MDDYSTVWNNMSHQQPVGLHLDTLPEGSESTFQIFGFPGPKYGLQKTLQSPTSHLGRQSPKLRDLIFPNLRNQIRELTPQNPRETNDEFSEPVTNPGPVWN